jgi:glycosyltransferase involved in cell wall biosynthesis
LSYLRGLQKTRCALNKEKILVFIDWYLPGYKAGGPIQSCANIIAHLSDFYNFSVVTGDTDYTNHVPYPKIVTNSWTKHEGTRVFYFSKQYLKWKNMLAILKTEEYDIVYFNSLFSLNFTVIPLLLLYMLRNKKKIILAPRGMFGAGALSVKARKKKAFIRVLRWSGMVKRIIFHASSGAEADDITHNLGNQAQIRIAQNLLSKIPGALFPKRLKEKGKLKMVFVARIAPEKNLHYMLTILQSVKCKVVFDIYGPIYNEKYWNQCLELIRLLPDTIIVSYHSAIEKSLVNKLLTNYHLLVHPTLGENFGHIILESLSAGCPVLISDQTPWHDLELKLIGADIPLANAPHFIAFIERFCALSHEEFDLYSKNAYQFASLYRNDPSILQQNIDLFK